MLTLLLGAILGAFLTLTTQLFIQFYVVPKVEARKRREDRWERDMRELGELLTTSLGDRATHARAAQGLFEDLRELEGKSEYDPDRLVQFRTDHISETRKATRAFTDLAHTRVSWLADRIIGFRPEADEITKFQHIRQLYWLRVAVASGWDEGDTGAEVEERWENEYKARTELIGQVKLLVDLPHPPRVSLRQHWWRQGRVLVHQAITWLGTNVRRTAIERTP
jgi:hypothetical protein